MIDWLKLPQIKNIKDLDDPNTTVIHGDVIQSKPFLKNLYFDFYHELRGSLPADLHNRLIVELGSGGGFIKEIIPNAVTSDIVKLPNADKQFSVLDMPFDDQAVDAFLMINVLHHINDARKFFREVDRCLKIGGKMVMVEPANTIWGKFIWKNFHYEPFEPTGYWGFKENGRLSSANGAIPWIVFFRDRRQFEQEFPLLRIRKLHNHTPFRYLLSGGVSRWQLVPSFTYGFVKAVEKSLSVLNNYIGMYVTIELEKVLQPKVIQELSEQEEGTKGVCVET